MDINTKTSAGLLVTQPYQMGMEEPTDAEKEQIHSALVIPSLHSG